MLLDGLHKGLVVGGVCSGIYLDGGAAWAAQRDVSVCAVASAGVGQLVLVANGVDGGPLARREARWES